MKKLLPFIMLTILLSVSLGFPNQSVAQNTTAEVKAQASVEFVGDWPADAQVAFQAAADIWAQALQPQSPLYIRAIWSSSPFPGTPGSFGYFMEISFNLFVGTPLLPIAGASYPKQLSNELQNIESDADDAFSIQVNPHRNWYFGLDGNTPSDQYDFVTYALRTIGLGIGFNSRVFFSAQEDTAGWGSAANPQFTTYYIYDHFLINQAGQPLLNNDSIPNHSKTFRNQLVDGQVYINSELARAANGGAFPAIDIIDPEAATSLDGSNIYLTGFLSEAAFPAGTPDGLMTPTIEMGEAIHTIGPVTTGILQEFGWNSSPTILRDSAIFDTSADNGQGFDLWSIVSDPRYDDDELTLSISDVADGTAGATVNGGRYLATNDSWTGTLTFSLNVENPDGKMTSSTVTIQFANLDQKIYLPVTVR